MTSRAVVDRLAEHVAGLRRYAFALTGGAQEAEDLVQETLVRAIAAAPRLPERGQPARLAVLDHA